MTPEVAERFWAKVDRSGGASACWPWTAGFYGSGYGAFKAGGKMYDSHRLALESALGESLGTRLALHRCDNPPCCNPVHLYPGSHLDNAQDRAARGRTSIGNKTPYEHRRRGSNHPDALLNEDQVEEIRSALTRGEGRLALAQRYGVEKHVIHRIAQNKTWRHVPWPVTA